MNCKHCNRPLVPGDLWGSWRCANGNCISYNARIVPQPTQSRFLRRHWSQRKRKA